jgi:hypothetical protein
VDEIHAVWRKKPSRKVKERILEEDLGTKVILAVH